MLQMKVSICCKTLSNRIRIQKSALKKQKPNTPYLIARGDNKKTTGDVHKNFAIFTEKHRCWSSFEQGCRP